jgi:hypothetical protein
MIPVLMTWKFTGTWSCDLYFFNTFKCTCLITFLANYWKNLCIDYKEVAIETAESARQKPVKALFVCSGKFFCNLTSRKLIVAFWVVTPCRPGGGYQHFRGKYFLSCQP